MSFEVSGEAYDRFMGRYSVPLAHDFANFAGIDQATRVLDVGCGLGALAAELARRLGPAAVSAVDPSAQFVAAAQERLPDIDVRRGSAEDLPFDDDHFDAALAQLVVHHMSDPVTGLREMARVTRSRGIVAACVWDHAGGQSPLGPFWKGVHEFEPGAIDESQLAGAREGHLGELFHEAGLEDIREDSIAVTVEHPTFDDWWVPFTLGVGPAGSYVANLPVEQQEVLRDVVRQHIATEPFALAARVWAARGIAS